VRATVANCITNHPTENSELHSGAKKYVEKTFMYTKSIGSIVATQKTIGDVNTEAITALTRSSSSRSSRTKHTESSDTSSIDDPAKAIARGIQTMLWHTQLQSNSNVPEKPDSIVPTSESPSRAKDIEML
jgi:hypothetical protein